MKNHCVKIKLHSDFLYYFVFQKYKQLRLTIIIRLFISNFSVQAPRRACKWARHEILRRQAVCGHFRRFSEGKWRRKPRSRNCHLPKASIRALRMTSSFLQGLRPCTLFRECEHICWSIFVQFDISIF